MKGAELDLVGTGANTLRSTRSVTVEYTPEGGVETGSLTVTTAGGTDTHAVTLVSH